MSCSPSQLPVITSSCHPATLSHVPCQLIYHAPTISPPFPSHPPSLPPPPVRRTSSLRPPRGPPPQCCWPQTDGQSGHVSGSSVSSYEPKGLRSMPNRPPHYAPCGPFHPRPSFLSRFKCAWLLQGRAVCVP